MKKYGNNILFEFESIIDMDFSMLKYIQMEYTNTKYMKDYILKADNYFLKCLLLSRQDKNPLSIILKEEYTDQADDIYNDILDSDIDKILKISEPTALFGLMINYNNTDGVIESTVLCKNKQEEQYIKSKRTISKTILCKNKFDISKYDSIFIKDINNLTNYENVAGKSIFILNYGFNFENYSDKKITLLSVSHLYTNVNNMFVIDPYVNFKLPQS